jgi:hypothetical protein
MNRIQTVMQRPKSITALLAVTELGGCVVYPDGYQYPDGYPETPEPQSTAGQDRDILVTTWQGSTEPVAMRRGRYGVKEGFVRVCMRNNKRGTRTLIHGIANINNLETAGSGQETCANFPDNITLNLTAKAAGRGATLANASNIRLSEFSGYHLWFIWG